MYIILIGVAWYGVGLLLFYWGNDWEYDKELKYGQFVIAIGGPLVIFPAIEARAIMRHSYIVNGKVYDHKGNYLADIYTNEGRN